MYLTIGVPIAVTSCKSMFDSALCVFVFLRVIAVWVFDVPVVNVLYTLIVHLGIKKAGQSDLLLYVFIQLSVGFTYAVGALFVFVPIC